MAELRTSNTTDIMSLLELKSRLYNPETVKKAEQIAAENKVARGPFNKQAYEAFIKDHPIFSKLHTLSESEEE